VPLSTKGHDEPKFMAAAASAGAIVGAKVMRENEPRKT
jgi:hypothetical protein